MSAPAGSADGMRDPPNTEGEYAGGGEAVLD